MLKKEIRLVITFHTTACAIAMEKKCKENSVSGRLIPVPREISAGCGLAWCAPVEEKAFLEKKIGEFGIDYQEMHEILI